MDNIYDIKIIKNNKNIVCFTYKENDILYFAKLFYLNDNEKLQLEYNREININEYIIKNMKNQKYYTKLLKIYENILPFKIIIPYIKNISKCNILIFEHSGFYTLKYYINKLSSKNFNIILDQLKEATNMLEDINIIHYDLYCQSNIMLKKINNKWIIKIIDYGLSYIDNTDKSKYDYNIAIDSIKHFNKKHII